MKRQQKTKKPLRLAKETLIDLDHNTLELARGMQLSCTVCTCGSFSEDRSISCAV